MSRAGFEWGCRLWWKSSFTTLNVVKATCTLVLLPFCFFSPPRKYLWNKLAFGQQFLLENYEREGELRSRQAVLQVQWCFAGFSHDPEEGRICSKGAAEDAVFGECFSFMSSE